MFMDVTCEHCGESIRVAPPYSSAICQKCGRDVSDKYPICPSCKCKIKNVDDMDHSQKKEFGLSGLCITCQNAYLGG